MSENCTERRRSRSRALGFTLPELIIVMILAGIMAAFVLPRLETVMSLRSDSWRDQVQAALRYAQKVAVSHRRLVCVDLSGTAVTLNIASVRGATSCNTALTGPDNAGQFGVSPSSNVSATMLPAGIIYFQPDGRATSDGAGNNTSGRTITIVGVPALVLYGETGYVQ